MRERERSMWLVASGWKVMYEAPAHALARSATLSLSLSLYVSLSLSLSLSLCSYIYTCIYILSLSLLLSLPRPHSLSQTHTPHSLGCGRMRVEGDVRGPCSRACEVSLALPPISLSSLSVCISLSRSLARSHTRTQHTLGGVFRCRWNVKYNAPAHAHRVTVRGICLLRVRVQGTVEWASMKVRR